MPEVMGAFKRKSTLILYKDGNSVKLNSSSRINNEKNKQNPLPLASDLRNNQAEEQFWVS